MKTVTLLKRARALIEKGWTRNVLARNTNHVPVWVHGRNAVRFCAVGAIYRAAGRGLSVRDGGLSVRNGLDALQAVINDVSIFWNDRQKSKAPVLRAFDAAIRKAQGK